MEPGKSYRQEETLDPRDWAAMRALGHRMVDDMMDYLETVRERPVWQAMPAPVRERFKEPVPLEPQGAEQAYESFRDSVLPYPLGNIHPRFWGWVNGTGTPLSMLAEMLAAAMNSNAGGGDHAAQLVEKQVIEWCKTMFDFPSTASGLLVSGGSMANLVGLTVARNSRAGYNLREVGVRTDESRMVLYASRETHNSVQRAVELLGLGSEALRLIPVDADFRMDLAALEQTIAEDRAAGYRPFCIVGNAGTVNTGAVDDLEALAELCRREELWFHVDGAFGALAALSPALRPLVAGMEKADSLAFDLHKWMYIPYEAGCALVRSEELHRGAFAARADYLEKTERGVAAGGSWLSDYGVQLSRGFRALKVWMSIKEHGLRKYSRMIQQNVEQARYLAGRIEEESRLELLASVSLNIVCFRFVIAGLDDSILNRLNRELLVRLHESGVAVPSYTVLNGKYALRVAITNQRSRQDDFDLLVEEVIRQGEEIIRELQPCSA